MLTNNISFTSRPIYNLKVKDENGKNVEATFSELNPKDEGDFQALKKMKKSWEHSDYGRAIISDFKIDREYGNEDFFYAIELKGDEPLDKRIIALGDVADEIDSPYIKYIQSRTHVPDKKAPKYKGAGEMLLYGIIKEAKRFGQMDITLFSTDRSRKFYEHIGYTKYTSCGEFDDNEDLHILKNDNFDKFIHSVENKHKLNQKI